MSGEGPHDSPHTRSNVVLGICEARNLKRHAARPRAVSNANAALKLWEQGKEHRSPALVRAALRFYAGDVLAGATRIAKRATRVRALGSEVPDPIDRMIQRPPKGVLGEPLRTLKRAQRGKSTPAGVALRPIGDIGIRFLTGDFAKFESDAERNAAIEMLRAVAPVGATIIPPIDPAALASEVAAALRTVDAGAGDGIAEIQSALRKVSSILQPDTMRAAVDEAPDAAILTVALMERRGLVAPFDEIVIALTQLTTLYHLAPEVQRSAAELPETTP